MGICVGGGCLYKFFWEMSVYFPQSCMCVSVGVCERERESKHSL